jgi:hypothetical protein
VKEANLALRFLLELCLLAALALVVANLALVLFSRNGDTVR